MRPDEPRRSNDARRLLARRIDLLKRRLRVEVHDPGARSCVLPVRDRKENPDPQNVEMRTAEERFAFRNVWLPNLAAVRTGEGLVPVMDAAVLVPRAELPTRPAPGERARQWRRWLAEGRFASRAELARAEGVSRAAVTLGLSRLDR